MVVVSSPRVPPSGFRRRLCSCGKRGPFPVSTQPPQALRRRKQSIVHHTGVAPQILAENTDSGKLASATQRISRTWAPALPSPNAATASPFRTCTGAGRSGYRPRRNGSVGQRSRSPRTDTICSPQHRSNEELSILLLHPTSYESRRSAHQNQCETDSSSGSTRRTYKGHARDLCAAYQQL